MKTLILNKSGGGFMKRILIANAVVLLSLGATRPALATTAMELVSGTDIIYYDGSATGPVCSTDSGATSSAATCSTFGATGMSSNGGKTLNVMTSLSFNGWTVSGDTGESLSPSCDSVQKCEDQNQVNVVNSGTATLDAYFASSGFSTAGPLFFGESSTALDGTGTATAKAYAYQPTVLFPPLGLSASAVPSLPGLFSTLSLTGTPGPGGQNKNAFSPVGAPAPGSPYNLASQFDFTPGTTNAGYSVTETIYTSTSVSESSSVGVFLVMLLGIAFVVRKGTQTRTNNPAQTA